MLLTILFGALSAFFILRDIKSSEDISRLNKIIEVQRLTINKLKNK